LVISSLFDDLLVGAEVFVGLLLLLTDSLFLGILIIFFDWLLIVPPIEAKVTIATRLLRNLHSTVRVLFLLGHQIKLLI
jgi:hypothetical protein